MSKTLRPNLTPHPKPYFKAQSITVSDIVCYDSDKKEFIRC